MRNLVKFGDYINLFEGGAAIKDSRRIRESEVPKTLESIKSILFPILGGGEIDKEYLIIGSIGKKKNQSDTSGDIDLGIDKKFLSKSLGVSEDDVLGALYKNLSETLHNKLGFVPDLKLMRGINVLSIGWPIEGDESKGIVQLDLIPIADMEWAKFIFYSPDYRKNESKYKSAHRNWLFQSILSALKEVISKDDAGEIEDFYSYALRLSDGIYKNKKSFRGATKRLKNPKTIKGETSLITRDPDKFVEMMFGSGVNKVDLKSFEDAWKIVSSPDYLHADKKEEIRDNLERYLINGDFDIPTEIK
jgi:hypothetical protein